MSVPDQALISNGNFQPVVLAIAHDALRIALAQVGLLSERNVRQIDPSVQIQFFYPAVGIASASAATASGRPITRVRSRW